MKPLFLLLGALLTACTADSLRPGDLLFQAGESDFTQAIETVTDGRWSHVGIVDRTADGLSVLEATPEGGVVRTPLEAFLDEAARTPDGKPVVQAFRVEGMDRSLLKKAVQEAASHLGKAYDFAFLPGTEAIYCSELVQACYRNADGSPLFPASPMTFKDSSGRTAPYWTGYYGQLGCDIPEGLPGTNPNDLSRDPHLRPLNWKP